MLTKHPMPNAQPVPPPEEALTLPHSLDLLFEGRMLKSGDGTSAVAVATSEANASVSSEGQGRCLAVNAPRLGKLGDLSLVLHAPA